MSKRPYIAKKFSELEQLVLESNDQKNILLDIYDELEHRKKNSNIPYLKKQIELKLDKLDEPENQHNTTNEVYLDRNSKPDNWDEFQNGIIVGEENQYKYVEAGPGTGKTAVACAKVAHLINEFDLEPSNILLISFTRTAIKEIKDRIQLLLNENKSLNGLRIYTLDSITWNILNGFALDNEDLLNGYNENIDSLIDHLKKNNYQFVEIFEEFEHVIIDEAQDLVGRRARLVLEILDKIPVDCGITVFADSAQGIYGFTSDDDVDSLKHEENLVDLIKKTTIKNLEMLELVNVHRTRNSDLIRIFKEGRKKLIGRRKGSEKSWKSMRDFIFNSSNEFISRINIDDIDSSRNNLFLFRTKAEVLEFSSELAKKKMPHSLRMSNIVRRVHPWIGRLFSHYKNDYIEKTEFHELWDHLIIHSSKLNSDELWKMLWEYCGESNRGISLRRLREILSRDRPPIDFLVNEESSNNIILSTIHSSKGRESDIVYLMLPNESYFGAFESSEEQILEEERVLYVGATRAINKLITSNARRIYNKKIVDHRICSKLHRKKWTALNIQVGLPEDIDYLKSVDNSFGIDSNSIQNWLWQNANAFNEAIIGYDRIQKENYLKVKNGSIVGGMSQYYSNDMWAVANSFGKNYKPKDTIKNVYITGCSTYVIPEARRSQVPLPWQKSGIMLVPVITGFPFVFFNKRKSYAEY